MTPQHLSSVSVMFVTSATHAGTASLHLHCGRCCCDRCGLHCLRTSDHRLVLDGLGRAASQGLGSCFPGFGNQVWEATHQALGSRFGKRSKDRHFLSMLELRRSASQTCFPGFGKLLPRVWEASLGSNSPGFGKRVWEAN